MNAPLKRAGKYMHTANGRKYWPMDPRGDEVHIEVIAHHLATMCRYNGAVQHPKFKTKIFYSVAEHSVYCSQVCEPGLELECLLHDASEAYIGDLIRPLKYDEAFSAPFKRVEEINEAVIAQRFGLPYPMSPGVKRADEMVTAAEVRQIIVKDPNDEWESGKLHDDKVVAPITIEMWDPFTAKENFLARYHQLLAIQRKSKCPMCRDGWPRIANPVHKFGDLGAKSFTYTHDLPEPAGIFLCGDQND